MKRSKHSLSHYHLTTGVMGDLMPVGWQEVLPGDTFQMATSALIRLSPVLAPVMHPVQVRIHHFFVPNRLLWSAWEDFITGQQALTPPMLTLGGYTNKLSDYLGVPRVTGVKFSALPVRAYNMIYNEYYRDQDLQPESALDALTMHSCSWEKDYFTSARPWPQKGSAVTIPLGIKAPVTGIMTEGGTFGADTTQRETPGTISAYSSTAPHNDNNKILVAEDPDHPGFPGVYADLTQAEAVDVNEFRKAFALQRYQEARARYGSRYTEYLRYLGITPSDARLQRPEYLGGGKQTISFSEVLQTAPGVDSVVGEMKGHGISAVRTNRFRKFFEEHGILMSLMSVRPKTMYTNGLHKKFNRHTKEDYYQKELELIGQQEVLNGEVFAQNSPVDEEVFGYADRYREYREHPSIVSRDFRNTLNHWHLARELGGLPALNGSFVQCAPSSRIFADEEGDHLWMMINHHIRARRMVRRNAAGRII